MIDWGLLLLRPKVFSLFGDQKCGGQISEFKSDSSNVWGSKVHDSEPQGILGKQKECGEIRRPKDS